jgi:hypothetical protein
MCSSNVLWAGAKVLSKHIRACVQKPHQAACSREEALPTERHKQATPQSVHKTDDQLFLDQWKRGLFPYFGALLRAGQILRSIQAREAAEIDRMNTD